MIRGSARPARPVCHNSGCYDKASRYRTQYRPGGLVIGYELLNLLKSIIAHATEAGWSAISRIIFIQTNAYSFLVACPLIGHEVFLQRPCLVRAPHKGLKSYSYCLASGNPSTKPSRKFKPEKIDFLYCGGGQAKSSWNKIKLRLQSPRPISHSSTTDVPEHNMRTKVFLKAKQPKVFFLGHAYYPWNQFLPLPFCMIFGRIFSDRPIHFGSFKISIDFLGRPIKDRFQNYKKRAQMKPLVLGLPGQRVYLYPLSASFFWCFHISEQILYNFWHFSRRILRNIKVCKRPNSSLVS